MNSISFQRLLSLTKTLTSHVNNGNHQQALTLFHHIHSSLALPLDPFVFPLTLKSCTALHNQNFGISIHAHLVKSSFLQNPFVVSALVDFYGKCVSLISARQLFDEMSERNAVVWNAMVSLYMRSNRVKMGLRLFNSMDVMPSVSTFNSIIDGLSRWDSGSHKAIAFYRKMHNLGLKGNHITALSLLSACAGIGAISLIKEIHCYSLRNNMSNSQPQSCLVEAYGKCGSTNNAHSVFISLNERGVVAWTSLISAYALHGDTKQALQIFHEMENAKVKPDGITFLSVLKACSHGGLGDEAKGYFEKMQGVYGVEVNSDHYSCLVDALSRSGKLHEAYDVIMKMPLNVTATAKTWGALLGACRTFGEVELAEIAAKALFEIKPDNAANYVILARVYANAGRFDEANKLRSEMKERRVKAVPGGSWV